MGLAAAGCSDGCKSAVSIQPVRAATPNPPGTVVFRGMCDASGAVVLGGSRFAVGDDEDNVLRVYDSARGGDPIYLVDVSSSLDLPVKKKPPEADIEAATRLGDRALWLTSHGLNSKGKLQPGRFRFFATTAPSEGGDLRPVGIAYDGLLDDMMNTPSLARLGLAEATKRAPKAGGLNIEGMTRMLDGKSVIIGFRNPRPNDRAIVVPLHNPLELIEGKHARFGEPRLLDLGGLGIRSLSLWRGHYLLVAGAMASEAPSRLFAWDGADRLVPIPTPLAGFNPEALVSREDSDRVMLLSDDGTVEIDGVPCKKLKQRERKRFRGVWVRVPKFSP